MLALYIKNLNNLLEKYNSKSIGTLKSKIHLNFSLESLSDLDPYISCRDIDEPEFFITVEASIKIFLNLTDMSKLKSCEQNHKKIYG